MTIRKLPGSQRRCARRSAGFSLVELMIAMSVALFLLGGLGLILQQTKRTYVTQTAMAQLQDNERLAMTLIASVVESAGYYPNPAVNSAATLMPVSPNFPTAGTPSVIGVAGANGVRGDRLTVRYAAGPTGVAVPDNVINCMGQQNILAVADGWENTFDIQINATNNQPQLTCTLRTVNRGVVGTFALVQGVQSMSFQYGLNSLGGAQSCIDTWKSAIQMLATDWANVCAVRVTLVFTNPVNPPNGTITFSRVVGLMNRAGVNT